MAKRKEHSTLEDRENTQPNLEADQDVLQVERLDSPDVDAAVLRQLIEAVKSSR